MKVGFIGLGRMGDAMARRLLDAGHEVGVYNRTPEKAKPLVECGARRAASVAEAAAFGTAVFTMLSDDDAVMDVATGSGGIIESLAKGGVHVCSGTHGVTAIGKLADLHRNSGQVLVAAPVLGRPEAVTSGQAGMVVGGPQDALARCRELFSAIVGRVVEAGEDPKAASAIKIANNFVLGCAIEAMGEGLALVRKFGVKPEVLYGIMTDGPFACNAYKVYGKLIVEERYLPAGQRAANGLKDANLALAAGAAVGVPLPSGNVWRDRLVGAVAHGEADHDWAVMAKDQARASGLA